MVKINWKNIIGWGIAALVVIGVVGTNIYQKREQKGDRPIVKIGALYPMSGAKANKMNYMWHLMIYFGIYGVLALSLNILVGACGLLILGT